MEYQLFYLLALGVCVLFVCVCVCVCETTLYKKKDHSLETLTHPILFVPLSEV